MVNLTVDDKQVTVPKDATIYDAAKAAGIRIPILCHDKKLHPFGGCPSRSGTDATSFSPGWSAAIAFDCGEK